jgi:hypothetical protein
MSIRFEKRPVESAARAAASAIRQMYQPLEETVATLGRIALLNFNSAAAAEDFAKQLRHAAQSFRMQATAESARARSLLKAVLELEQMAIILASSKGDKA